MSSLQVWRWYCTAVLFILPFFGNCVKAFGGDFLRYRMTFTDHRDLVKVMEFDAPTDAAAIKAARHHMAVIKAIFRRDHPGARVRSGWYVLHIVSNVDTCTDVYKRR